MLMNVASGEHLRRRSVLPRLRSGQRRQRWKRVRATYVSNTLGTNLPRHRSPEPLVSFPGAYTGYEPGILIVRPSATMCMIWMKAGWKLTPRRTSGTCRGTTTPTSPLDQRSGMSETELLCMCASSRCGARASAGSSIVGVAELYIVNVRVLLDATDVGYGIYEFGCRRPLVCYPIGMR